MAYTGYQGYGSQQERARRRDVADLLMQQALTNQAQRTGSGLGNIAQALSAVGSVYAGHRANAGDRAYGDIEREAERIRGAEGGAAADTYMQTAQLPGRQGSLVDALMGRSGQQPTAPTAPTAPQPMTYQARQDTGGSPMGTPMFPGLAPSPTGGGMTDYLHMMAQGESGGDPNAQNATSGATGLFQFMPSTWAQYGGGRDIRDPEAQRMAMADFTADNGAALQRAGLPVNPATLALAHQQGAGGAVKLLSNPDAPAASIVGRPAVEQNGGSADMTAGQFAQHVMGYYTGQPGGAGGAGGMASIGDMGGPAPESADPTTQLYLGRMAQASDNPSFKQALEGGYISPLQRAQFDAQRSDEAFERGHTNRNDALANALGQQRLEMGSLELEAARNPQPEPGFTMATPEQAAQYGATGGQFGPDGRFYPINPPSGMSVETGPDGQVRVVQGPGVTGSQRPLTEAQSKDNLYLTGAIGGNDTLNQYEGALVGSPGVVGATAGRIPIIGNIVRSQENQMATQGAAEFGAAILRKESGAALTASDHEWLDSRYIPKVGDSPEVLAAKRDARARAIAGLRSGMSADQIRAAEIAAGASAPPAGPPQAAQPQAGTPPGTVIDGYRIEQVR